MTTTAAALSLNVLCSSCVWLVSHAKLGIAWARSRKADDVHFTQLLHEASPTETIGPLRDDDPPSQARGLVVLSFTAGIADLASLDPSSCTAGLAMCHCWVHLLVVWFSVYDSV